MIGKCKHKIGIYSVCRGSKFRCEICGRYFKLLEVMNYLEENMGMKAGVEYWRKLRHQMDKMRIERKKGISFEGFWPF